MQPVAGRTVVMFPGQGSQRAGMARHLLQGFPECVDSVLRRADAVLGLPLRELCLDGSDADLRPTEITQPALLAVSYATWTVLLAHGLRPDVLLGHSLGEYTALTAAGSLTFDDALRLVRRRGELMAEAAGRRPGAMAAVEGLPAQDVDALCREVRLAGEGEVYLANHNAPDQTVVSGETSAVDALVLRLRGRGPARAVLLPVSAAFHSALMREADEQFSAVLAGVDLHDPVVPVVAGTTASVVRTAGGVRAAVAHQLSGAVHWHAALLRASGDAPAHLVEVGPGRVLTGLAKRTVPGAETSSTGDDRRLGALVTRLLALPSTRRPAGGLAAERRSAERRP